MSKDLLQVNDADHELVRFAKERLARKKDGTRLSARCVELEKFCANANSYKQHAVDHLWRNCESIVAGVVGDFIDGPKGRVMSSNSLIDYIANKYVHPEVANKVTYRVDRTWREQNEDPRTVGGLLHGPLAAAIRAAVVDIIKVIDSRRADNSIIESGVIPWSGETQKIENLGLKPINEWKGGKTIAIDGGRNYKKIPSRYTLVDVEGETIALVLKALEKNGLRFTADTSVSLAQVIAEITAAIQAIRHTNIHGQKPQHNGNLSGRIITALVASPGKYFYEVCTREEKAYNVPLEANYIRALVYQMITSLSGVELLENTRSVSILPSLDNARNARAEMAKIVYRRLVGKTPSDEGESKFLAEYSERFLGMNTTLLANEYAAAPGRFSPMRLFMPSKAQLLETHGGKSMPNERLEQVYKAQLFLYCAHRSGKIDTQSTDDDRKHRGELMMEMAAMFAERLHHAILDAETELVAGHYAADMETLLTEIRDMGDLLAGSKDQARLELLAGEIKVVMDARADVEELLK